MAVIADAFRIKADTVIANRVHDAFRASPVFTTHLRHLEISFVDDRTPGPS